MSWVKRLGLLLTFIGLLVVIVWGLKFGLLVREVYINLRTLQALAQSPDLSRLGEACRAVELLSQDLEAVEREGGILLRLASLGWWLPKIGDELKALPLLFQIAKGLSEAGAEVCRPLQGVENPISLLASSDADWGKALASVQKARELWPQLPPSFRTKFVMVEKTLPLAETGFGLLKLAPELLGAKGQRTYLILAQNEDEIRPTGGFITGVGEVRVERGEITSLVFRDSYAVDDFSLPYPDPPEPLRRYMGIDLWVFRDSNWSPDFPTSARRAISLYRPGYRVEIDGVIAVDQEAVRRIVEVLGPLKVEGEEEPITGKNLISYMREAWAPEEGKITKEWWVKRKTFMASLAQAIFQKLKAGDLDWLKLGRTLLALLEEKHILIYLQDPEAASFLSLRGWDGSLRPSQKDFLMVVDANVGYNKVNARVKQSITYEVDLALSPPQATLTLIYTHTAPAGYPCRPEVRYDPAYEKMMERCYWDYIRVYTPSGSRLLDATRIPIPAESLWHRKSEPGYVASYQAEEGPWTVLAVLGLIPPSQTQTRSFSYVLPPQVLTWDGEKGLYHLRVQKQPGTLGHPLTIKIHLPSGSELLEVTPEPSAVEGETVLFNMALKEDREISLSFRRQK